MWKSLRVFFIFIVLWSSVLSQSKNCKTPHGKKGVCVSLYDCPDLLKAFEQKPLPNSMVSFLKRSECIYEDDLPGVCCGPLPSDLKEPAMQRLLAPAQGSSSFNHEDSSPAPKNQCGVNSNGDRIYGGKFAELNEFPWMALLGYRNRNRRTTYECSGGLINHRYILTAAHCIAGPYLAKYGNLSTVRLGEYNTQNDIDCVDSMCADPPQEMSVASAYPHPGYSDKNKNRKDDIGIVRLATRAQYNYFVQPICLVDNGDRLKAGEHVYVAGWGKTLYVKKSPIKLKVSLSIFNKDECNKVYKYFGALLGENQLCAGGVFLKDACAGDSGGPLMKMRPEGVWEAVGVISFSNGCGGGKWPGVYASVAKYIDWIKNTLKISNV